MRHAFSISGITKCTTRWAGRGALMAIIMLVAAPALFAADPKSQEKKPASGANAKQASEPGLDDALLKDLDNELLEGAGNLKTRPKPKPEKSESEKPGTPGEKRPEKSPAKSEDAGEDVSEMQDDPLWRISQQMRSSESLIPKPAKRGDAEQLQQQIIDSLAKLIEQAEKQSSQQPPPSSSKGKSQQTQKRQRVQQPKTAGGSKDSKQPAKDSTERLGKAEAARPDPEMVKGLLKDSWGNLPPKAREQMLQNSPERFLPQYELLIERYYRRLAEEQNTK